MKSPDEPTGESWTGRDRAFYFGALAFHIASGSSLSSLDKDFEASMRANKYGEPADQVFQWMDNSFFAVLFIMIFFGFFLRASYSRRPWIIRRGSLVVWVLPLFWLILWITVFRPHS